MNVPVVVSKNVGHILLNLKPNLINSMLFALLASPPPPLFKRLEYFRKIADVFGEQILGNVNYKNFLRGVIVFKRMIVSRMRPSLFINLKGTSFN